MWRRDRPTDPAFEPEERLFSRLPPRGIASDEGLKQLLAQFASDDGSDVALRDDVAKRLMPRLQFPRYPRQSMNREKHEGKPTDVLWPSKAAEPVDEPVIAFTVAEMRVARHELPAQTKNAPSPGWVSIEVEHCPEEDNYGHCEMKVERNETGKTARVLGADDGGDVPSTLKAVWRRQVSRRCRVVYMPAAAGA